MKPRYKLSVALMVTLAVAIMWMIWAVKPLIGPLSGTPRSPDEQIDYVERHNAIVLVDPVPVIRDGNGGYYHWARAEFAMRRNIAVALGLVSSVALGIWAWLFARRLNEVHSK